MFFIFSCFLIIVSLFFLMGCVFPFAWDFMDLHVICSHCIIFTFFVSGFSSSFGFNVFFPVLSFFRFFLNIIFVFCLFLFCFFLNFSFLRNVIFVCLLLHFSVDVFCFIFLVFLCFCIMVPQLFLLCFLFLSLFFL